MKKITNNKKVIAIVVVVAIVLGIVINSINKKDSKNLLASSAISAKVEKTDLSSTVDGAGKLAAGGTVDIQAPVGVKIEDVKVESGESVTKGQILAIVNQASVAEVLENVNDNIKKANDALKSINNNTENGNLKTITLQGKINNLNKTKANLEGLLNTPAITASNDGIVNAVNVKKGTTISLATISASSGSSNNSNNASNLNDSNDTNVEASLEDGLNVVKKDTQTFTLVASGKQNGVGNGDVVIGDTFELGIQAPITGQTHNLQIPQSDKYILAKDVKWNSNDKVFASGRVYTATVTLKAKEGFVFSNQVKPFVARATSIDVRTRDNGKTVEYTIIFAATNGTNVSQENQAKSLNELEDTYDENELYDEFDDDSECFVSQMDDSPVITSNVTDVDLLTAFVLTTDEKMTASINVDELDINNVQIGQKAKVKVDAAGETEIDGTITKISKVVSSSNTNSTKYPVEVTINKSDKMIVGMSASVKIIVKEVKDAITLPINAIQDEGENSFVYTKQDKKGNLSGKKKIKIGESSGDKIQIVSGLKEGEEVYYEDFSEVDFEID